MCVCSHDDQRPTENIQQKIHRQINICENERILCYLIRIFIGLELLHGQ